MAAALARRVDQRRRGLLLAFFQSICPALPSWQLGNNPSGGARSLKLLVLLFATNAWLAIAGCRTGSELVEAELRRKERENEQLSQKLRHCECEVRLLEAEYERLLREIRSTGKAELRSLVYLKSITLGRLTGGLDDDPDCPGDDALVILLEPRDLDDQVVKVPGHVHVDVYEITPQGLKQPLSSWDIPARELRGKWETPLIGSPAFRLVLRWKVIPHYDRLRIVVRFTTLDGQVFETDRDVTIRLPRREADNCRLGACQSPLPVLGVPHRAVPGPVYLTVPHDQTNMPTPAIENSSPPATLELPLHLPRKSSRASTTFTPTEPLPPNMPATSSPGAQKETRHDVKPPGRFEQASPPSAGPILAPID